MEAQRERLYIGSKVMVWKNKSEWDDDVVQFMIPRVAILFERDRDTLSEDGVDDHYGVLFLKRDGTASHFQWWVEGDECVLINNDLAANQDFIYANRGLLETCDGEDEPVIPDDDDEEMPTLKPFFHVIKASRAYAGVGYSGKALLAHAGYHIPSAEFRDVTDALFCAERLSQINPVGFVVYNSITGTIIKSAKDVTEK